VRPLLDDWFLLLQTSWMDMLRGFGLALIVAVISSLYPAWRSRRLSIVGGLSRH
jgi:ABC-type antimicrobial peptide transport system permease subunit